MISAQQTPQEWLWFIDQLPIVKSVLEIGSYDGQSLVAWATSGQLSGDAVIRSIDMCLDGTKGHLTKVCADLSELGFDAKCYIGDSHTDDAESWATRWAPYDVVFIDGDHSAEGVRQDWIRFGRLGRIVGFHDILGHQPGSSEVWRELSGGGWRTSQY